MALYVFIVLLLCVSFYFGCLLAAILIIFHIFNNIVKYKYRTKVACILIIISVLFLLIPGTIIFRESDQSRGVKVLSIVYGYPSKGLMEEAKKDRVILGGCCLMPINPVWAVVIYEEKKGN